MAARAAPLLLVFALAMASARPALARDDLGFAGMSGPQGKAWLSPDGAFAAQVPPSWQPRAFLAAQVVEFHLPQGAWFQVRRVPVAPGTAPMQLLLRAREMRLAKLPHFQENGRGELSLGGAPAASVLGNFWYQGNAEYPRAVEEVFVVVGNEAFEMHFECFGPAMAALRPDVLHFYGTFVAHPAAAPPPQQNQAQQNSGSYFDSLPF